MPDETAVNAMEAVLFGRGCARRKSKPVSSSSRRSRAAGLEMVRRHGLRKALRDAFVDVAHAAGVGWPSKQLREYGSGSGVAGGGLHGVCGIIPWEEMRAKVGQPDNLLVLKKPFDNIEVQQLAHALTKKWFLNFQGRVQMTEVAKANEFAHATRKSASRRRS